MTELIISEAHQKVYHNGVKETLAEVRSVYWIPRGRQTVKKIIKRCYVCRKLEGLAYPPPVTADLPECRVEPGIAFETAGVDFCGPVYVKEMYKREGDMHKAYIALTTCATSRMLHLEITPDLTTAAYIRSQRRFISRRGYPRLMISDNGKTFKGIELRKFNAKHGIQWKFNLARAPWWGGMFERMVRCTKRCLIKAIGQRKLTYEELSTVILEVEAVINNRPLTYIDEDDKDCILTPSHLFCGRRMIDDRFDAGRPQTFDTDCTEAACRTKQVNSSIEHFWKRWMREYLVELRENHKMQMKKSKFDARKGDVVLIYEDGVKRNKWKLGVIEEKIIGKDGVARGAVIRKFGGDGSRQIINRPIQKLYPLEIDPQKGRDDSREKKTDAELPNTETNGAYDMKEDEIDNAIAADPKLRSKRTAAIDGQIRRRLNELKMKKY